MLGRSTSSASSHREAPYILSDPSVDNSDVYAFVSPNDAGKVSLIANWAPFSEPAGGPNFFPWDTTAAYDIHIDNDGDAKPDITYRWTFSDVDKRGTVDRGVGNGGESTFLYADGPVTTLTDENLLLRQTYDLGVITDTGTRRSSTTASRPRPTSVRRRSRTTPRCAPRPSPTPPPPPAAPMSARRRLVLPRPADLRPAVRRRLLRGRHRHPVGLQRQHDRARASEGGARRERRRGRQPGHRRLVDDEPPEDPRVRRHQRGPEHVTDRQQ
ncbi:MAG: DUF4331 domain-containing protein [Actinobacteria bacterium]|nr:DUF4331 domain-containing protein [Actinomycetota bacterium]